MTKILITPQFGIGDAILTTPALKLLKEHFKNSEITFFTFNKTIYELLKTNPYLDKTLYYPLLNKSKIFSFFYVIKNFSFKFDIAINFYPSNRKDYNIFSFLTFSKKRIGHRYNHFDFSQLNWLKNLTIKEMNKLHCVEENVRLLKFFGLKIDKNEIPKLQVFLTEQEIDIGKKYINEKLKSLTIRTQSKLIGIHSGSSIFKNHFHRRWPKEKFAELIEKCPDFVFFIFGGNEDKEACDYIYRRCKENNVIMVKNKNIREVAAIIKNLDLFVSNDSGLMHLAAAVETPVVAILGPTNPDWISPWKVEHKIVRTGLECSPCFYYSPKPLECKNIVKWKCLKDVSVKLVSNTIEDLLTSLE